MKNVKNSSAYKVVEGICMENIMNTCGGKIGTNIFRLENSSQKMNDNTNR